MGKVFEINTETQICLRRDFDICHKTDQLWANTFVRTEKGEYFPMGVNGQEDLNRYVSY